MSVYLANQNGRVIEFEQDQVAEQLKNGLRKATRAEIDQYTAKRAIMNAAVQESDTVYFQTVKGSPDGYGMSRDHLIKELGALKIQLVESYQEQKVGLLYNYPYGILSMRSPVRLIFTMFESDKIPDEWPDYLNMADEVIVPSTWCKNVFARSGVKATVVPLGYNSDLFTYIDRPIPEETGAPFTFIHYDSFNYRKGFSEVFQAFTEEFAQDEPVRLILKTAQNSVAVPIMPSQYPNIEVITGSLPEKDLVALLGRANCMVYPSRGEGFGITPLEAMATGLPAIVPNEHGISEYFNPEYMIEVKATDRCPALYSRFKGEDVGQMVVADVPDLKKQMRAAFEGQAAMKSLGQAASKYVQQYTYKETAKKLAEVIERWRKADHIRRNDSKYLQVERI